MACRTQKLKQLWRLVRESHAQPLVDEPQLVAPVAEDATAVTLLAHSSFLIQMAGKAPLIDPVFAARLIVLRRQRRLRKPRVLKDFHRVCLSYSIHQATTFHAMPKLHDT